VINYVHFRLAVNTTIKEIAEDPTYTERAGMHYIEASSWLGFLSNFRRCLVIRPIEYLGSRVEFDRLCFDLKKILPSTDSGRVAIDTTVDAFLQCKDSLFQLILSKALVDLSDTIKAFQSLNMTTDLKKPHEWYPLTRIMKRKIIFHGGPTNSGKTYHALQRLKEASLESYQVDLSPSGFELGALNSPLFDDIEGVSNLPLSDDVLAFIIVNGL